MVSGLYNPTYQWDKYRLIIPLLSLFFDPLTIGGMNHQVMMIILMILTNEYTNHSYTKSILSSNNH